MSQDQYSANGNGMQAGSGPDRDDIAMRERLYLLALMGREHGLHAKDAIEANHVQPEMLFSIDHQKILRSILRSGAGDIKRPTIHDQVQKDLVAVGEFDSFAFAGKLGWDAFLAFCNVSDDLSPLVSISHGPEIVRHWSNRSKTSAGDKLAYELRNPSDSAEVAIAAYRQEIERIESLSRQSQIENSTLAACTRWGEPDPIGDIKDEGDPIWLWKGFLACGYTAQLNALPKAGKTELLAHLLKALGSDGTFLGYPTRRCNILIVSEEHAGHWARRRDRLGIGNHVRVWSRPFGGKPSWDDWEHFNAELANRVKREAIDLIIFDTYLNCSPIEDVNDPGQTSQALSPISSLASSGAAVLVISHSRKSGGDEGTAIIGSTTFAAWFDNLIELRRFTPNDKADTRRIVEVSGRWEEGPPSLVIDRPNHDEYVAVGMTSEVRSGSRDQQEREKLEGDISEALTCIRKGLSPSREVVTAGYIEDNTQLTRGRVKKAVASLVADGRIVLTLGTVSVGATKQSLKGFKLSF